VLCRPAVPPPQHAVGRPVPLMCSGSTFVETYFLSAGTEGMATPVPG
jgi:hypothetical protein